MMFGGGAWSTGGPGSIEGVDEDVVGESTLMWGTGGKGGPSGPANCGGGGATVTGCCCSGAATLTIVVEAGWGGGGGVRELM